LGDVVLDRGDAADQSVRGVMGEALPQSGDGRGALGAERRNREDHRVAVVPIDGRIADNAAYVQRTARRRSSGHRLAGRDEKHEGVADAGREVSVDQLLSGRAVSAALHVVQ
jgi:hypothetical protein